MTYDLDYRLTDLAPTDGVTPVQDLAYTYGDVNGDAGNIRLIENFVDTAATPSTALSETLSYDIASNQLQTVTDGSGTRTLGYTANGQVTSDTRGLGFDTAMERRG